MKKIVTLVLILAAAGVGYALFTQTGENMTYYFDVDQALAADFGTQRVKISGVVAPGSIEKQPAALITKFVVKGTTAEIPVEYTGVLPDIFRDGIQVVVAGSFSKDDGVFYSDDLLAKCPSKYQAKGSKDDFSHLETYEIEYDHRQGVSEAAHSISGE